MELEPVIGLEIHIQLKTKSKMFCSCSNIFGDVQPNSAICPICLGYPGTLPVPNATAIQWTQLLGAALNCELAQQSKFDRKSYFYPDLPKGYQISQYDQPFCGAGELTIIVDDQEHKIGIERIHLEEDAAKNTHPAGANYTLIDFNRAGTPLAEIVTKPSIPSPAIAKVFLQELQRLARLLQVSDADMEKGQLRCDANISLRERGSSTLHPKTEIKNINSFRFVEQALQYEIKRQTKEWSVSGPSQTQSTRGFDSATGKTIAHRTKEAAADYRYFPEPDIPPFSFTSSYLKQITRDLPELPPAKRRRLQEQFHISQQQAALLVDYPILANYLENTVSEIEQLDNEQLNLTAGDRAPLIKEATNVILRHLREMITSGNLSATDIKINPANFAEMIVLIFQGKLNRNSLAPVLSEMQRTGGDPDHVIANLGLEQLTDEGLIQQVEAVMLANPDVVAKVKAGKNSARQFLIGQVMQKTKGQANAAKVMDIITDLIK